MIDATACPQDIAYPTDLNLLNDSRIKSEELIDRLHRPDMGFKKPRTLYLTHLVFLKKLSKKLVINYLQSIMILT